MGKLTRIAIKEEKALTACIRGGDYDPNECDKIGRNLSQIYAALDNIHGQLLARSSEGGLETASKN